MYRPTVRYPDVYQDYVNNLFHATTLDRNQIFRLALFHSAFSDTFRQTIEQHRKLDVLIPSPTWKITDARLWQVAPTKEEKGGKDVNVGLSNRKETGIPPITNRNTRINEHTTAQRYRAVYRNRNGLRIRL